MDFRAQGQFGTGFARQGLLTFPKGPAGGSVSHTSRVHEDVCTEGPGRDLKTNLWVQKDHTIYLCCTSKSKKCAFSYIFFLKHFTKNKEGRLL